MKYRLEILLENAAFADPGELPRILREEADRLEADARTGMDHFPEGTAIRDRNGNLVGGADFEDDDEGADLT